MHLIMVFLGLGIVALFVTGAVCQGSPGGAGGDPGDLEEECDLVMGGAAILASDEKSQSFYNIDGLKIVRPDEATAIVTGHVVFLKDFKKNFMARVVVNKEKMGKTQMAMSYDICDFCGELNNDDSLFKMELDALGFPRECPFDAGKFDVHNLTVNTDDMPINSANQGIYEAELCVYEALDEDCKELDLQGCVVLPFTIECS